MNEQDKKIDPRIGQRIQLIREHMRMPNGKKVTRNILGEWFNKSPKTVQSWESGTRKVPEYVIEALAKKLNIDEDFIRCNNDDFPLAPCLDRWDAELAPTAVHGLKRIEYIESLLGHSINDQLDPDEVESYLQEIDDFIIFKYHQIMKRKKGQND